MNVIWILLWYRRPEKHGFYTSKNWKILISKWQSQLDTKYDGLNRNIAHHLKSYGSLVCKVPTLVESGRYLLLGSPVYHVSTLWGMIEWTCVRSFWNLRTEDIKRGWTTVDWRANQTHSDLESRGRRKIRPYDAWNSNDFWDAKNPPANGSNLPKSRYPYAICLFPWYQWYRDHRCEAAFGPLPCGAAVSRPAELFTALQDESFPSWNAHLQYHNMLE